MAIRYFCTILHYIINAMKSKNQMPEPTTSNSRALRGHRTYSGDPEIANVLARSELLLAVAETIKKRGWTQSQAAQFLGVGQPRISNLMQGRVDRFTVDMLMMWLHKLGKHASVSVQNGVFHTEERVGLALYVCGAAEQRLLDNVGALFGGDKNRYSLKVINVLEHPALTTRECITATPSLVKETPKPRVVLIGDLSANSVRWQLSVAERAELENRHAAQELRQAHQDQREAALTKREQVAKKDS